VQSATHRFIHIPQTRFVISSYDQLELGQVFKEILPHEAGGYAVATSQRLYPSFCPPTAILGFDRSHEASTTEPCQVCGVLFGSACCEDRNWSCLGIIAKQTSYCGQKHGLAIRASAEHKEKGMLPSTPGEAVPNDAL